MRFGVLGTGTVGRTLSGRLVELGHEVRMGSRAAGHEGAAAWAAAAGDSASHGDFADAAGFGERVINATAGAFSLDAVRAAGRERLDGKVLIDVANPLDFSRGMPPRLSVCNDDSLAEQLQRELPGSRVVKTLNTVNAGVMVRPGVVGPSHTVFVCGDDETAKSEVTDLLVELGWPRADVMDLGDITAARAAEMYLPLWLRLRGATGTGRLNVKVLTSPP